MNSETSPKSTAPAAKPTLLIVDDEEGPRQSLRVVFKGTYDTVLADCGSAALEIAKSRKIDVAILDIRMAEMSGTELLGKLKAFDPAIEVVMLTAYETMDTAKQAIRHGACDYLTKPFEIPVIREAVDNAIKRRQLTEAISSNQGRLDELQHQLQDRSIKEELARSKNEIYESVMHDIGSPLTAITVLVQLINYDLDSTRGGTDPEKVKEQLAKVNHQVGRCIEISRRYLDYARQRAAGDDGVMVNQCLKDVEDLALANPAARNHSLKLDLGMVDVKAAINGTDLIQILLNLVNNAFQATDKTHSVWINSDYLEQPLLEDRCNNRTDYLFKASERFTNSAPMVAITVKDDGPGISTENLHRVFESYFSTKAPGKGTGLGLAIVSRLIENAAGAISVQSIVDQGTGFTVFLPIRI